LHGTSAASLAKPSERIKLLTTDTNAVYAPGADRKGDLLWQRGGTLVAQEFDADTLKFAGETHPIADIRSGSPVGQMKVAISTAGILLYGVGYASTQFTWFDRTGKPLGEVGEPGDYLLPFRLSPDDRRVVAQSVTAGISHLWLLDAERGLSNRFTVGAANNTYPIWSPDGRTILFARLGSRSLFRKDANGVGDEQLVTHAPSDLFPTDWSRNGQFVIVQGIRGRKPLSVTTST